MNQPKKRIDFDRLNLFGKAIYVGGATFRFIAEGIDAVVNRTVDVYLDTEKAFKQGLDPNIEDAKILDEQTGHPESDETSGTSPDAPPGDA
jgi:hypothetical protein